MSRSSFPAQWLLATVLILSTGPACTTRGGGGGGDDDDDNADCGDADAALQGCYSEADLGDTFTPVYCPATNLTPGTAGYMGPDTDWDCIAGVWDAADCSLDGSGWSEAAECDVDPGGDDDDATGDDDDSTPSDDDDSTPPGDDDDSTPPGDDDDSTPPGDDDDSTPPSTGGVTETLTCGATTVDVWSFNASSGASISVFVDTTSASTAFDPMAALWQGVAPSGTELYVGDDDAPCTYPPPQYSCPSFSSSTSTSGQHSVVVAQASDSCAGSSANYVLYVTANGSAVSLSLNGDDITL